MKNLAMLIGISFLLLVLAGCRMPADLIFSEPATATPPATPSPLPTATPTPTPTPTPVPAARVHLGDKAWFNGDWQQALAEYQIAAQNSPDAEVQAAARIGIARTQLSSQEIDGAIQTLEALLQSQSEIHASQTAQAYYFLAQAYSAAGRHAEAAEAYTSYLNLSPGVIDAYILDLRGGAHLEAGNYPAAATDFQAALALPSVLDSTFLEMKTARAYALGGEYDSALALYDDIYARSGNDYTKALINLRKGQIFTNLGQIDQAHQVFLDGVNEFPTSYDTYSALQTLVEAGVPVDDLNAGLVYYYAGDYGNALASFDHYLQNAPADPGTGLFYTALINREIGDHQATGKALNELIDNYPEHQYWDDAWEQLAYTQWWYLDDYPAAVQTLLDFVDKNPTHPRAGEFTFDAAQIAERDGQFEQAADLWERMANLYPGDENASRALFLAGITRYRAGDYAAAQATFEQLVTQNPPIDQRTAALFWIGKAQLAQNNLDGARQAWEQTQNIDPTGYYSERAREILRNRTPFTPPIAYDLAYDLASERIKADEWVRSTFNLPPETDLSGLGELASDPAVIRGNELWHLGQYDDARSEFEQVRLAAEIDAVQSYRLANHLLELGLYRSAIMAARNVLDLAGLSDADSLNAPPYFNHLRFGTYFSELVLPAAQQYQLHPLLLFSLIRQESLFEGFVRSSAAASGLMQIMPGTGEELAGDLGWPPNFTSDDLSRPLVSITLGSNYLKKQLDGFDGDVYAALAAYNGGPGNALQWKELAPDDPDLFLEVIRFSETRNYIRGIYEIFNIYRRIYDRTP